MKNVLELTTKQYKVVVGKIIKEDICISGIKAGFVTDKTVDTDTLISLCQIYFKNKLDKSDLEKVLITKAEWNETETYEKIIKQIIHYYSLGTTGVNSVELQSETVTFDLLKVVSEEELKEIIYNDIYSNKSLSESKIEDIVKIITYYNIEIDSNKIENNEIRIALYELGLCNFINGDDVLRYLIFKTTGNTLLIKSKEILEKLREFDSEFVNELFTKYDILLAEVFNRHKKIILSVKDKTTRNIINRIAKMSKKRHKPIIPAINKTFMSKVFNDEIDNISEVLDNIKLVDKFKFLNLLSIKMAKLENKFFQIRNGKTYYKPNVIKTAEQNKAKLVYELVLNSAKKDLSYLKGKTVKYPDYIDYGLPISEKQSINGIPFNTVISGIDKISIGIYWENNWGAKDLDLSMVDTLGNRTGWGDSNTYNSKKAFAFSGDITNAENGAMEFFSQNNNKKILPQIFINNIYDGNDNSKYKIIIGKTTNETHMNKVLIELDTKFKNKTEMFGVYNKGKFILYQSGISKSNISSPSTQAFLPYITVKRINMKELLEKSGVLFTKEEEEEWDYDLSLESISFDKLQNIFKTK